MSQSEVGAIMKTRFKLKAEDLKMQWEQVRVLAFYSAFDKLQVKTAREFMPFEWDDKKPEVTKEPLTKEQMIERYNKMMESKNHR